MAEERDAIAAQRGPPPEADPGDRLCWRCDYDLRLLDRGGRCPECGEPIRRSVLAPPCGVAEPWLSEFRRGVRLTRDGATAILNGCSSLLVAAVLFAFCFLGPVLAVWAIIGLVAGVVLTFLGLARVLTAPLNAVAESSERSALFWVRPPVRPKYASRLAAIRATRGLIPAAVVTAFLWICRPGFLPAYYRYLASLANAWEWGRCGQTARDAAHQKRLSFSHIGGLLIVPGCLGLSGAVAFLGAAAADAVLWRGVLLGGLSVLWWDIGTMAFANRRVHAEFHRALTQTASGSGAEESNRVPTPGRGDAGERAE